MNVLEEQVEQFHREGYLIVRGALSPAEVRALRAGVERAFAGPEDGYGPRIRVRMFERGPEFEALIDHPAAIDLVEALLGPDCHLIAENALKTGPGETVAGHFHADEMVRFPLPLGITLDPRVRVPCFNVNTNYYLCDVGEELGPTQFVPGSHRSGRNPGAEDCDAHGSPVFEGRGAVSATGEAGDLVLWHDQLWHRGAPNRSAAGTRITQQAAYGRRFIAQRFYPFINYRMPEEILARANPRRQRLLGMHPRGAYG